MIDILHKFTLMSPVLHITYHDPPAPTYENDLSQSFLRQSCRAASTSTGASFAQILSTLDEKRVEDGNMY